MMDWDKKKTLIKLKISNIEDKIRRQFQCNVAFFYFIFFRLIESGAKTSGRKEGHILEFQGDYSVIKKSHFLE